MSKDETMTCDECFGRYKPETCPKCNGTGITTTGKFLGTLPSTPDPVTDEPHEPTTQGDAQSVVTGNGLRYVYAPGHDSGATVTDERDATIAEQAAEIEAMRSVIGRISSENTSLRVAVDRLKSERDTLRGALETSSKRNEALELDLGYREEESRSHDAALKEVTADRDVLRLENQRLKDASFEAQDRYAAIEAERDSLRDELEHVRKVGLESLHEGMEHRHRAEKYLRVIRAKDAELVAVHRCWVAAIKSAEAMTAAGMVIDAFVQSEQEEPDHD